MKLFPILLLASLTLTACSTVDRTNSWPDLMPSKPYFINYYSKDIEHQKILSLENYLIWIQRFYLGWQLYSRGWLQVAEEVSQTVSAKDRLTTKEKILQIGKLIAPEWAKNQRYRVINTHHLGIWGNAINESIIKSEQRLILNRILTDVKGLLDGKLKPKDITDNRYYDIDVFSGNW